MSEKVAAIWLLNKDDFIKYKISNGHMYIGYNICTNSSRDLFNLIHSGYNINISDNSNMNRIDDWVSSWRPMLQAIQDKTIRSPDKCVAGFWSDTYTHTQLKCVCSSSDLWAYGCPIDRGVKCRSA